MKTFIQKLGKSLMGPLSIIVAAGLLLGLASTLQNPMIFGNSLANVEIVNTFISLVNTLSGGLFGLLPILFCMSVAMGMSKEDKEIATFASIIGFVLFHTTIRFFLNLKGINADTTSIDYLVKSAWIFCKQHSKVLFMKLYLVSSLTVWESLAVSLSVYGVR